MTTDQIAKNQSITSVQDHGIADVTIDNFDYIEETFHCKSTAHVVTVVLCRSGPNTVEMMDSFQDF